MSSVQSPKKKATSKFSNSKKTDEKVQNPDPIARIDNIISQLEELARKRDTEEIFYNRFQNSFYQYDIVSIEPTGS